MGLPLKENTIISVFNDRGTLLQWMQSIEDAIKGKGITSLTTTQDSSGYLKLSLNFADGTSIVSPSFTQRGEQGVSITGASLSGDNHLMLQLSNGSSIDAGQVLAGNLQADSLTCTGDVKIDGELDGGFAYSLTTLKVNSQGDAQNYDAWLVSLDDGDEVPLTLDWNETDIVEDKDLYGKVPTTGIAFCHFRLKVKNKLGDSAGANYTLALLWGVTSTPIADLERYTTQIVYGSTIAGLDDYNAQTTPASFSSGLASLSIRNIKTLVPNQDDVVYFDVWVAIPGVRKRSL